nr:hypothetical protein [Bacillus sp. FJAT-49711]
MERLEARKDEMIKIHRYLHENPELSFEEEKTAKYILDFYDIAENTCDFNHEMNRLRIGRDFMSR